jgi:RNA polymerase sigma-70 factor (ECF subfamily)
MTDPHDSTETDRLIQAAADGDKAAVDQLLSRHRPYLRRVVELRMDPALRSRVDPSDVVQETQFAAAKRFDDFITQRPTTFRLWLRRRALQQIIDDRRRHLAIKRSVHRDVSLTDMSSMAIAQHLICGSPSKIVQRQEVCHQVHEAITQMSDLDREVLLLRYVEDLTNGEVAELLEITPDSASRRHGRAVRRLCELLTALGINLD